MILHSLVIDFWILIFKYKFVSVVFWCEKISSIIHCSSKVENKNLNMLLIFNDNGGGKDKKDVNAKRASNSEKLSEMRNRPT